ncbi:MAG: acyl-CoA desaturase [Candidatus Woykebacteria bacterium]
MDQITASRVLRNPEPAASLPPNLKSDYDDLKGLVERAGLLDKQLSYYIGNITIRLALLTGSVAFLLFFDNFWLQLLNAAFLAFAFAQIGFLGHDAGHKQIFAGSSWNYLFGLLPNLLLGLSRGWWVDTHNEHHSNPNDLARDPHTRLPIFAFSEDQALSKQGLPRLLIRYQALYFFPILLLEGIGTKAASIQYLLGNKGKSRLLEALLMALHLVIYVVLVLYALGPGQAVAFIVVHQALFGLYLGLVFAPNHKGMPLLDGDSQLGFLRSQVRTSRDIMAHPITDFWYGGLNYQIEHHLFPWMPRNKLREAQVIVRAFCEERSIPYYETSAARSLKEIYQYLRDVSAPVR